MPSPAVATALRASKGLIPRALASATTALPSGCSLPACTAAAIASKKVSSPSKLRISATTGLPSVNVPVLSKTTVSISLARSSVAISRIKIPALAPAPVPATNAVGVASPSAQGQAITSTEMAATSAVSPEAPNASHAPKVTKASPIIVGTKTADIRSTSFWIGALPTCAASTICATLARVVSSPTREVCTCNTPPPLIAPAITSSPGTRNTGIDSPVIRLSSSSLLPSTMNPSTGTRAPGRNNAISPTLTCSTGSVTSPDSERMMALVGRSSNSLRNEELADRLARLSIYFPRSTSVITTVEASK